MQKRYLYLALVVVMTLVIGSCQTPAGRTAGEVIDDATITTKVKAKLLDEGALQGLAISVDTFEGEVTLTGAVKNEQQRETAGKIVRTVSGVKAVNNLLKIKGQ